MAPLLKRSFDAALLAEAGERSHIERVGFDPESLVREPNVLLQHGGDLALFEYDREGVYSGHYFFQSRGREAVNVGRAMLDEMFKTAEVIQGLTPVYLKHAIVMNRLLGFKPYGLVDTVAGPMGLYILTKKEHTA